MAVRVVFLDFHETLISADRWMALETGEMALELARRLALEERLAAQGRDARTVYARLREISIQTGVEYTAADVVRALLRAAGLAPGPTDQEVEWVVAQLFREYLADVTVKDGAGAALEELWCAGYRLAVLSNAAYAPFLSWALDMHGLLPYFDRVVTSAEVGVRKPMAGIFQAAMEAMGVAPAEAAHVGDDYIKDVMGARLAGLRAIWIPSGRDQQDYCQYTPVHPDTVIAELAQLPTAIRGLDEPPGPEASTRPEGRGGP